KKHYRVMVVGLMSRMEGPFVLALEGKPGATRYTALLGDMERAPTSVMVKLDTGKLHMRRRNHTTIGHPDTSDTGYGNGSRDGRPLRLTACVLEFVCPFTGNRVTGTIEEE